MIIKNFKILFFVFIFGGLCIKCETKVKVKSTKSKVWRVKTKDLIDFSFKSASLIDMVNRFSEKKRINIMIPPQAEGLNNSRLTFKPSRKLSVNEAEKYLYLFLDYAGYTLVSRNGYFALEDVKGKQQMDFPGIPLFVFGGESVLKINDLPDNDEFVRIIYYFDNFKLKGGLADVNSPVDGLLKNTLTPENYSKVIRDASLNAVVFVERARIARSVIYLFDELDSAGRRFVVKNMRLAHAKATDVEALVGEVQPTRNVGSVGLSSYIKDVKVKADDGLNSLIIMGRAEPVNRLEALIRERIDVPLESGKSLFHVYDVNYLDAQDLATVLGNVIGSKSSNGQATVEGTKRSFEGVVIKAEEKQEAITPGVEGDKATLVGGNKILVAANPSDWEQIKKLIKQLDVPQRQVILEILIVDYERKINKVLNAQTRNLMGMDFKGGFGAQTAQFDPNNIYPSQEPASTGYYPHDTTIVGDLMAVIENKTILDNANMTWRLKAATLNPASLVLTFNESDGSGIWSVISLLNDLGNTKVLASPYLVTVNGKDASVKAIQVQRAAMEATSGAGGAIVSTFKDLSATTEVKVRPLIASENKLSLAVEVKVEVFTDTIFSRNARAISTQINMESPNQVAVLGGLTLLNDAITVSQIPILGSVPIIGNLFKRVSKSRSESELAIFIRPVIVEPRVRNSMNKFTRCKIDDSISRDSLGEENLRDTKDPVDKLFFTDRHDEKDSDVIKNFVVEMGNKEIFKKSQKPNVPESALKASKEAKDI